MVDECHRGSAADDSAWREILEYFSSATQIGLTATPKETEYVSNIQYFGDPIYSYSLKQGIQDGFLAPYKVVKVHIDRDVEGYRPEKGNLTVTVTRLKTAFTTQRTLTGRWFWMTAPRLSPQGHRVLGGKRRPFPKNDRVLRRPGTRRPNAPGVGKRKP